MSHCGLGITKFKSPNDFFTDPTPSDVIETVKKELEKEFENEVLCNCPEEKELGKLTLPPAE